MLPESTPFSRRCRGGLRCDAPGPVGCGLSCSHARLLLLLQRHMRRCCCLLQVVTGVPGSCAGRLSRHSSACLGSCMLLHQGINVDVLQVFTAVAVSPSLSKNATCGQHSGALSCCHSYLKVIIHCIQCTQNTLCRPIAHGVLSTKADGSNNHAETTNYLVFLISTFSRHRSACAPTTLPPNTRSHSLI